MAIVVESQETLADHNNKIYGQTRSGTPVIGNWYIQFVTANIPNISYVTPTSGHTIIGSYQNGAWCSFIIAGKVTSTSYQTTANISSYYDYFSTTYHLSGIDSGITSASDVVDQFAINHYFDSALTHNQSITPTTFNGLILAAGLVSTRTGPSDDPYISEAGWNWLSVNNQWSGECNPYNHDGKYKTGTFNSGVAIPYTPTWDNGGVVDHCEQVITIKNQYGTPGYRSSFGDQHNMYPPNADTGSFEYGPSTYGAAGDWLITLVTVATDDLSDISINTSFWTVHSTDVDSTGKFTSIILYRKCLGTSDGRFDWPLWDNVTPDFGLCWNAVTVMVSGLSSAPNIAGVIDTVKVDRSYGASGTASSVTPSSNCGMIIAHVNMKSGSPKPVALTNDVSGWTASEMYERNWGMYCNFPIDHRTGKGWTKTSVASGTTVNSKPIWSLSDNAPMAMQFMAGIKDAGGGTPPPPPRVRSFLVC